MEGVRVGYLCGFPDMRRSKFSYPDFNAFHLLRHCSGVGAKVGCAVTMCWEMLVQYVPWSRILDVANNLWNRRLHLIKVKAALSGHKETATFADILNFEFKKFIFYFYDLILKNIHAWAGFIFISNFPFYILLNFILSASVISSFREVFNELCSIHK